MKLPLIGSKLNAMFLDALLDNQKIKGEHSEFKLQDTEQAMLSAQKRESEIYLAVYLLTEI